MCCSDWAASLAAAYETLESSTLIASNFLTSSFIGLSFFVLVIIYSLPSYYDFGHPCCFRWMKISCSSNYSLTSSQHPTISWAQTLFCYLAFIAHQIRTYSSIKLSNSYCDHPHWDCFATWLLISNSNFSKISWRLWYRQKLRYARRDQPTITSQWKRAVDRVRWNIACVLKIAIFSASKVPLYSHRWGRAQSNLQPCFPYNRQHLHPRTLS